LHAPDDLLINAAGHIMAVLRLAIDQQPKATLRRHAAQKRPALDQRCSFAHPRCGERRPNPRRPAARHNHVILFTAHIHPKSQRVRLGKYTLQFGKLQIIY